MYRNDINIFEAAANGAAVAGKTVGTVIINYIAFLGLLAWINAILFWLGDMVGFPYLSFEVNLLRIEYGDLCLHHTVSDHCVLVYTNIVFTEPKYGSEY